MATIPLDPGALTDREHWQPTGEATPSSRFWSPFDPNFTDITRLLRRHITNGTRTLELGFAPGKFLAFAAYKLGAIASGVDFNRAGVASAERLFDRLEVCGDLRHEDAFATSFPANHFDVVMSFGLAEHFDDPRPLIAKHIDLLRPGGTALVVIPDYGGVWGRWQARLDPDNLAIHNTDFMTTAAFVDQFDPSECSVEVRPFGRPTLHFLSIANAVPLGGVVQRLAGMAGTWLPEGMPKWSPMLLAVATKHHHADPSGKAVKSADAPVLFSRT